MSGRIACLGKFDALHRGHFALAEAAHHYGQPVLIFMAGMDEELGWEPRAPLVAAPDRARVLQQWSNKIGATVDQIEVPFAALRPMIPADFVDYLAHEMGFNGIVTGPNFRFGKDRTGDVIALAELAAQRGLQLHTITPVVDNGLYISSTRIRAELREGCVGEVADLLGRPYRLSGTVIRGDGRGASIGFPTANIGPSLNFLPQHGVYAAMASLAGTRYMAAVNIGVLPTIAGARAPGVEAHLLDYDGSCYGDELHLDIRFHLRAEQRFDGLAALTAQIQRDVAECRRRLST